MRRAAQHGEVTPGPSRETGALRLRSPPAIGSGAEPGAVAVAVPALTGNALQSCRLCCEIHGAAILVPLSQRFQGFQTSDDPGDAAGHPRWQSEPLWRTPGVPLPARSPAERCGSPSRDHAAVRAESGEWGQRGGFPQKCPLSWTNAPPQAQPQPCPADVRNVGSEGRIQPSAKDILGQVFFNFVHLWVHKNISDRGEDSVTAEADNGFVFPLHLLQGLQKCLPSPDTPS